MKFLEHCLTSELKSKMADTLLWQQSVSYCGTLYLTHSPLTASFGYTKQNFEQMTGILLIYASQTNVEKFYGKIDLI